MRLVKGEIMKFRDGQKPSGFEKSNYCVVVQTGDFDLVGAMPSDQYGQTKERDFQAVPVSHLERTGKLIWEFDYTLFPHIIELLREYYVFAVVSDEQFKAQAHVST